MKQSTRQSDIKFDMIAQTHTLLAFIVSNYLTQCILLFITSVLFQRFRLAFISNSIHDLLLLFIIIQCPLRQATFLKHANLPCTKYLPQNYRLIYNEVQFCLAQLTQPMVKPVKSSLSVCLCVNLAANGTFPQDMLHQDNLPPDTILLHVVDNYNVKLSSLTVLVTGNFHRKHGVQSNGKARESDSRKEPSVTVPPISDSGRPQLPSAHANVLTVP